MSENDEELEKIQARNEATVPLCLVCLFVCWQAVTVYINGGIDQSDPSLGVLKLTGLIGTLAGGFFLFYFRYTYFLLLCELLMLGAGLYLFTAPII